MVSLPFPDTGGHPQCLASGPFPHLLGQQYGIFLALSLTPTLWLASFTCKDPVVI